MVINCICVITYVPHRNYNLYEIRGVPFIEKFDITGVFSGVCALAVYNNNS